MPLFQSKALLNTDDDRYLMRLENGRCPFLGKDNRCTIYAQRPDTCRTYYCWTKKEMKRSGDYEQMPSHRRLLRRWRVMPGQINESKG